jgi:predicted ATPase
VHFVGRAAELEEMEVRLERALGGSGNLLIIDGEAGVGKTRLAYELLRRAGERGATVISATCQQLEQQLPFASLADSLGRYLYGLPDESVRCLPQSSLTQLAQIVPSLQDRGAGIVPPSADAAGVADENRQRLIDGIVSLFAAMATLRPLVLLLDDLQWSDPDTLAVLSRLAQRLGDLPILLLLSYRNDDLSENDALGTLLHAFNRSHAHSLLHLTRFTAEQVTEFVALHWQEEAASAPRRAMPSLWPRRCAIWKSATLPTPPIPWPSCWQRARGAATASSACAATSACRRSSSSASPVCLKTPMRCSISAP